MPRHPAHVGRRERGYIITDPPYGLAFMGKEWDHGVPGVAYWAEALRVAKPGAMLCAFGGTRTHHRLMCAIEDAGWEIRDCLMWVYGSGFPKSANLSKMIDAKILHGGSNSRRIKKANADRPGQGRVRKASNNNGMVATGGHTRDPIKDTPATPDAVLWEGYGTALKPAYEPIILAMKPLPGTFAQNALDYGVAGINVDGCRVPSNGEDTSRPLSFQQGWKQTSPNGTGSIDDNWKKGRWPANLLLSHHPACNGECHPDCPIRLMDEQSGESGGGSLVRNNHKNPYGSERTWSVSSTPAQQTRGYIDTGGASRFFTRFHYSAKASRSERELGLLGHIPCVKCGQLDSETHINAKTGKEEKCRRNGHPTVKPLDVCRWLCKLTRTPTGGVVLDPFMGSGRIPMAAILEGRDAIGIELERPSFEIAQAACRWAEEQEPEVEQMELIA